MPYNSTRLYDLGTRVCFYTGNESEMPDRGRVATVEEFNTNSRRTLAELLMEKKRLLRPGNRTLNSEIESAANHDNGDKTSEPYVIIRKDGGSYVAVLESRVIFPEERLRELPNFQRRSHGKRMVRA